MNLVGSVLGTLVAQDIVSDSQTSAKCKIVFQQVGNNYIYSHYLIVNLGSYYRILLGNSDHVKPQHIVWLLKSFVSTTSSHYDSTITKLTAHQNSTIKVVKTWTQIKLQND